jgi:hypothetical protein
VRDGAGCSRSRTDGRNGPLGRSLAMQQFGTATRALSHRGPNEYLRPSDSESHAGKNARAAPLAHSTGQKELVIKCRYCAAARVRRSLCRKFGSAAASPDKKYFSPSVCVSVRWRSVFCTRRTTRPVNEFILLLIVDYVFGIFSIISARSSAAPRRDRVNLFLWLLSSAPQQFCADACTAKLEERHLLWVLSRHDAADCISA